MSNLQSKEPKKIQRQRQRLFFSDLKSLLYAFGDCSSPNVETIHFLEDILTSYLIDVTLEANKYRLASNRTKLKLEDFKFALRRDPTKLGRLVYLFHKTKSIAKAKKLLDDQYLKKPKRGGAGGAGGGSSNGNTTSSGNSTSSKKNSSNSSNKKKNQDIDDDEEEDEEEDEE
ncbi:nucleic acid binding protein [[Candida] boidinii]|nr:nucleic acid binding protein [[Candida] boidinii]